MSFGENCDFDITQHPPSGYYPPVSNPILNILSQQQSLSISLSIIGADSGWRRCDLPIFSDALISYDTCSAVKVVWEDTKDWWDILASANQSTAKDMEASKEVGEERTGHSQKALWKRLLRAAHIFIWTVRQHGGMNVCRTDIELIKERLTLVRIRGCFLPAALLSDGPLGWRKSVCGVFHVWFDVDTQAELTQHMLLVSTTCLT